MQNSASASPQPSAPKIFPIALLWSVIFGVFCIASLVLFTELVDMEKDRMQGLVLWAGAVAVVIFAQMSYKKKGDGFMGYGQGLGIAVLIGVFGALICAIGTYIYFSAINPEAIDHLREMATAEIDKNGKDDEGAEVGKAIVGFAISAGGMASLGALGVFFRLLIVGLIVSIFMKKESAPTPY